MLSWLKSLFRPPEPSGPPQVLRAFSADEGTLTRGDPVTGEGWCFQPTAEETIRLFEIPDPGVDSCVLSFRAQLKSDGLAGQAYLEMWCRFPGRGEFFSKGLHQALSGSTDWTACETLFHLKKGERPDLLRLNVAVTGGGTVRVREVSLQMTPMAY